MTTHTVAEIQARLNEVIGAKLVVDNKPGPKTTTAIKIFQASRALQSDGIVGRLTLAALWPKEEDVTPVTGIRQVTAETLHLIERFEALRLKAYYDSVGVITIGYGHTGPEVHAGMVITWAQAESLLRTDVGTAERAVSKYVKVALNDNQYGALVSLVFNIGGGAFASSTLLDKLNAGNFAGAEDQFAVWNKGTVNGRKTVLAGLVNRRRDEAAFFAS